ncbi:hypothetical protein D3C86_1047240 [compost metagenome]
MFYICDQIVYQLALAAIQPNKNKVQMKPQRSTFSVIHNMKNIRFNLTPFRMRYCA